jgi:pyrimidine-specific ribonucleoside hydrolase
MISAALVFSSAAPAAKPVIFDTDMAIDDWLALLFLLKHEEADVIAVTISASGESHCQAGLDNVRNLLRLAGHRPVPVACGDDFPLDGYFVFPEPWQVDSDTLSGIDLGHWIGTPVSETTSDGHAAELIHRLVAGSEEAITLVAVGPMTNIAQWLQWYPKDRLRVAELVMMGGNFAVPGNIVVPGFSDDNPNKVSEWNYYIDPLATKETLEADGLRKVMVGLDVTNTVRLTHPFADRFKQQVASPSSEFVDRVFDKNRWFIDSGEYYFWDVLAALVVVDANLCKGRDIPLTAMAEPAAEPPYLGSSDLSMPAMTARGQKRRHLKASTAGQVVETREGAPTRVCLSTDSATAFDNFISTLSARSRPPGGTAPDSTP